MAFTKLLLIMLGTVVVGVGASALTAWGISSAVLAGYDGSQGQMGDTGQDGADGTKGAVGPTGAPGVNGNDGAPGARGLTGDNTGVPGPTGPRGATGPTGAPGASLPAAITYGPGSGSAILPIDGTKITLGSIPLTPGTYTFSAYASLTVTNLGPFDDVTCGNDLVSIHIIQDSTAVLKKAGVTVGPTPANFAITCVAGDRSFSGGPTSTNIQVAWTDLSLYAATPR